MKTNGNGKWSLAFLLTIGVAHGGIAKAGAAFSQPPPPPAECKAEFKACTPHPPPFDPDEVETVKNCVEKAARNAMNTACLDALDKLAASRGK